MTYLIIYIVGYVLNYYWMKWLSEKVFPTEIGWVYVFERLLLSCAWPVSCIVYPICYSEAFGIKFPNTKPPRWL